MKILKSKIFYFMFFAFALASHAKAEIKIFEIRSLTNAKNCDGYISVLIDGNSGPYDITAVLNGKTTVAQNFKDKGNGLYTFYNLCEGDYEISVTNKDAKIGGTTACIKILKAKVIVCTPFDITIEDKAKIICNDNKDGFIDISVKGGTEPYKYFWKCTWHKTCGQTTQDIYNLEGNNYYSVIVTDHNGCSGEKKGIDIENQVIQLNLAMTGATSGKCNGTAFVAGIGIISNSTTSDFKYLWSNGKTTKSITDLCGGLYKVTVTSAEGCTKSAEINVIQCSSKPITLESFSPSLSYDKQLSYCTENKNNQFYVYVEGGTLPIKYSFKKTLFTSNTKPIQSGIITKYANGFAKIALLNIYNSKINEDYAFSVEDACGQKKELVYKCDCSNNPIRDARPFEINSEANVFGNDRHCDGKIELAPNNRYNCNNKFLDDDLCFIHWPDNTESKCYIAPGALSNIYCQEIISGKKEWKPDKKGFYTWNVTNRYGCIVYDGCFDYDPNAKEDYCQKSFRELKNLANGSPQISLKDLAKQSNNQYKEADDMLYGFHPEEYCGILSECGHPSRTDIGDSKDFVYKPTYPDFPCAQGRIYTCGNSEAIVQGGIEIYDIDDYNKTDECKINCGCIFPAGIFAIKLSTVNSADYPTFVKTQKAVIRTPPNPACDGKDNQESDNPDEKEDIIAKCGENKQGCAGLWIIKEQPNYKDCYYDIVCAKDPTFLINTNCGRIETCYVEEDGKCKVIKFCPYPFKALPKNHTVLNTASFPVDCNAPGTYKSCKEYEKFKEDNSVVSKVIKTKSIKSNETYAFVYPNPFEQQISVTIGNNKSKIIKIALVDILGRIIQTYNAEGIEGENNFELNIPDSTVKGIYYLQIIGEDYKLQYPIVHQ